MTASRISAINRACGQGRRWEKTNEEILAAAAFAVATLAALPASAMLQNGVSAPDFSATGMTGGKQFTFKLSDALKKGPVVVFFFPAAYTEGCTIETQAFSEKAAEYQAAGATLIGVTGGAKLADGTFASAKDSLVRLGEFSKEHCRDKFPMVAISADTVKAYDVSLNDKKPDWSNRTSFVIAPDGKVLLSHTDMAPDSHIEKTLATVKAWKAAQGGKHTGH